MLRRSAAPAALVLALTLAATHPNAHAQVAPMEVVLDVSALRASTGDPTQDLEAVTSGTARVRANGVLCVAAVTAGERRVILVGTEEQPEVCRQPGAFITVERAEGTLLRPRTMFAAGATFGVDDFGPPPAIDPTPVPMRLTLDPFDGPSALGPFTHGQVAVFADGALCAIADTTGATRVEIEVGGVVSPLPCVESGTELRLFNGRGQRLFETFPVVPGGNALVQNFAYPIDPGGADLWPLPIEPMEIVVESPPGSGLSDRRLFVFAGIYICSIRELNEPREVIVIGEPDQPSWCRSPGVILSFELGVGNALLASADVEPGGTFTLDDFTLAPPAGTEIVFDVTADPNATLDVFPRIRVLTDGVPCAGLQPVPRVQRLTLDLDIPDAPDACHRPGAFITFDIGPGIQPPGTTTVLEPGTRFLLTNFGPLPAVDPGVSPMSIEVRPAPSAGASLAELTDEVVRVWTGETICTAQAVRVVSMVGETVAESVTLTVGANTQALACREPGSPLQIVDASNSAMVELPFESGGRALVLVTEPGQAIVAPAPAPTGHGVDPSPADDPQAPLVGLLAAVVVVMGARLATRQSCLRRWGR